MDRDYHGNKELEYCVLPCVGNVLHADLGAGEGECVPEGVWESVQGEEVSIGTRAQIQRPEETEGTQEDRIDCID